MGSIVINTCYGGFGISKKGLHKLWQESPEDSYWNTNSFEIDGNFVYLPERVNTKIRTDKYLIKCIQKYGSEFMSGQCAELSVYTTDANVVRIEDCDGYEKVIPLHDTDIHVLE